MNDTLRTPTRPEVEAFVAEVRDRLADLTDDERDELLGGLEADLSEQLADGGDVAHVLGDPATYAAELRAAAGLPEHAAAGRRRWLPPVRHRGAFNDDLDDLRSWFFRAVDRHAWTRRSWELLVALRPAWWVLRAWLAVTFVDQQVGRWEYVTLVPSLGVQYLGPAVLVAAIVVSTLIGTGRLWPGSGPDRPLVARLLLAAANVGVLLLALTFAVPGPYDGRGDDGWRSYEAGYRYGKNTPGLRVDGETVRNVFAYDREGRLLEGVQLFRGNGEPLAVRPGDAHLGKGPDRTVGCGWFNGTTQLFNVFPLAQREQRRGSCLEEAERRDAGPVGSPEAPFAVVPKVVSPVPVPVEPTPPAEPDKPARAGR